MATAHDPVNTGWQPGQGNIVVRPTVRSLAALYYALPAAMACLASIPGFQALSTGNISGGFARLATYPLPFLFFVGVVAVVLRRIRIVVDRTHLHVPGGRMRDIPRERIAGITRHLVGECVVDEDGTTLSVLPNFLTRAQVSQISDALGVPHMDKNGREVR